MENNKTLKQLGYKFNEEGKLVSIQSNQPYKFDVSENKDECRRHYDDVAVAVTEHVYKLLETQEHLHRLPVPVDAKPGEPSTFVFASEDYAQKDTLMVLVTGSGMVCAGEWGRRIIINDGLDKGSQIPYIKKAKTKNYGILLMNINDNERDEGDIEASATPRIHGKYVWTNYISKTKAKNIVIVVHSEGAYVVNKLLFDYKEDFEKRVKAVAYCDPALEFANEDVLTFLKQISKSWISSSEPLDTPIINEEDSIVTVSAGTTKHMMTPATSIESVFKYIDSKLKV